MASPVRRKVRARPARAAVDGRAVDVVLIEVEEGSPGKWGPLAIVPIAHQWCAGVLVGVVWSLTDFDADPIELPPLAGRTALAFGALLRAAEAAAAVEAAAAAENN